MLKKKTEWISLYNKITFRSVKNVFCLYYFEHATLFKWFSNIQKVTVPQNKMTFIISFSSDFQKKKTTKNSFEVDTFLIKQTTCIDALLVNIEALIL